MFLRLELPSRSVLILFVAGGTLLLLAKDYVLRLRASHLAAHGKLSEPVLLAGLPEDMERLIASFTTAQKLQIDVVGRIDISAQPISALVDALHQHSVTRVIFAAAHGQLERVQAAIEACETEGVEAWMMADFIRTAIARPTFDMLGERPMLVFRTTSDASWELLAKRVLGEKSLNPSGHVDMAYRLVLGRLPTDRERSDITHYLADYRKSLQDADHKGNAQLAAWTSFCQTLFASGEFRYVY
jgi:hypothetical protein